MNDLAQTLEQLAAEAPDHHEFRRLADPVMRARIGYDVASWASLDPASWLFTSCDVIAAGEPLPHDPDRERRLFEIEFAGTDPFTYAELARTERAVSRLRSEVEDLGAVRRHRELIEPAGLFDELRLVVSDRTGVWGAVTMYRTAAPAFDQEAASITASVAKTLAGSFRHAFLVAAAERPETLALPPGVLTLDAGGRVVGTSEPAERWLDTLTDEQMRGTLASLAARLDTEPIARATVAGTAGPVTFHAFPRKGSTPETAVVVERPRPAELADLLIAAHGLTPRETDITRAVLMGLTTRQIATRLELSEYTVQDHLRSVFSKFEVATRAELCATIHTRFYLPAVEADATPGPYGWFLEA